MSWSWRWHPAALYWFRELHPTVAARLDAAVIAYTATGNGPVSRLMSTDPRRLVILVEGAGAILFLDEEERTVEGMRVWRRR